MTNEDFLNLLQTEAATLAGAVGGDDSGWIIKGLIDVYRRIYTISVDTKIVSKVLEILLLPSFAECNLSWQTGKRRDQLGAPLFVVIN